MQTLIRDTLDTWREAERTLDQLPTTSSDHETVAFVVLELRATYQRLTESRDVSQQTLDRCRSIVDDARALLHQAQRQVAEIVVAGPSELPGAPAIEAT